jgi:hypothetical protein
MKRKIYFTGQLGSPTVSSSLHSREEPKNWILQTSNTQTVASPSPTPKTQSDVPDHPKSPKQNPKLNTLKTLTFGFKKLPLFKLEGQKIQIQEYSHNWQTTSVGMLNTVAENQTVIRVTSDLGLLSLS